jgi:hypothetical protein
VLVIKGEGRYYYVSEWMKILGVDFAKNNI